MVLINTIIVCSRTSLEFACPLLVLEQIILWIDYHLTVYSSIVYAWGNSLSITLVFIIVRIGFKLSQPLILPVDLNLLLIYRQRRSEEGFASVSFDSSSSLWRCSKPDSSLAFSIFIFFIFTCIFTLIRKTDDCTSIQKRNDNPSACRKQNKRNYRIF